MCSPPDLYGTSDGWGAQSGAVRRGVHISKKKCHPYGWHLRLSKNDKTQSCNRAAGRKDFFDTLKCHPYGWHFIWRSSTMDRIPNSQKQNHTPAKRWSNHGFVAGLLYQQKNTIQRMVFFFGDPYGNRTHVTAVKGRCLNRLTNGPGSGNLTRTDDTPGMNRMLYQLSYAAIYCCVSQQEILYR